MKKSIVDGASRGTIYVVILKALQNGDKYGYEICKEVEDKTNKAFILKQPSLYSGLKRLESSGFVSSYWKDSEYGGKRHYYSITSSGEEKLKNSNFSWEHGELMDTLFDTNTSDNLTKTEIEEKLEQDKNEILINDVEQKISEDEQKVIKPSNDILSIKKQIPTKKAFALEPLPLQQDLFSYSENINNSQNEIAKEPVSVDSEKSIIETVIEKKQVPVDNLSENLIQNFGDSNLHPTDKYLFDKMKNQIKSKNSYSQNIMESKKTVNQFKTSYNENSFNDSDSSLFGSFDLKDEKEENVATNEEELENSQSIKKDDDINFKDIFGSFMVDNEKTDDNSTDEQKNNFNTYDDMPRLDLSDNVNINFNYKKASPLPNINVEYPNLKSGKKLNTEEVEEKPQISASNIEKLQGIKIRIHQRLSNSTNYSKYIAINKCNFLVNSLMSMLMIISLIMCFSFVSLNATINSNELAYYILGVCFSILFFSYYLVSYLFDKNKKIMLNYNILKAYIKVIITTLLTLLVVYAINLFFGFSPFNYSTFPVQTFLPMSIASVFIFQPLIKLMVTKNPAVYK